MKISNFPVKCYFLFYLWGFFPSFLRIHWQSQFIFLGVFLGRMLLIFVFSQKVFEKMLKYNHVVLSTCWCNITETFCVIFFYHSKYIFIQLK
jgi:hypothetical protein